MKKLFFVLLASVTLSVSGQTPLHQKYLFKTFTDSIILDEIEGQLFTVKFTALHDTMNLIAYCYPSDSLYNHVYCSKETVENILKSLETISKNEISYHTFAQVGFPKSGIGIHKAHTENGSYYLSEIKEKENTKLIYLKIAPFYDPLTGTYYRLINGEYTIIDY